MIRIGSLSVYVLLEVDVGWDDNDGLPECFGGLYAPERNGSSV